MQQRFSNIQLDVNYFPSNSLTTINIGLCYSINRGRDYITQYNYKLGLETEMFEKLIIGFYLDYRIKFLGKDSNSPNNLFIRSKIIYDIF